MSILSRLRCITVDVTGTLIAYKGDLGDYYCMAAKAVGLPCPDYKRMHEGFKHAYKDMSVNYPCFGFAAKMPNIVWWRTCVKDSFVRAGYDYDEETFDKIFKRIYSTFGSSAPYSIFADSQPFLRWARQQGITVGLVSNAEYRYKDVILPALGLNQGSEWDFGVFSGVEGVEKPNPRIYEMALERAGNIAPEQALHIGDSIRKDYNPAKSIGMQALLIDRFKTAEADEWRKSGAPVLPDLVATQEWLTFRKITLCIMRRPRSFNMYYVFYDESNANFISWITSWCLRISPVHSLNIYLLTYRRFKKTRTSVEDDWWKVVAKQNKKSIQVKSMIGSTIHTSFLLQ